MEENVCFAEAVMGISLILSFIISYSHSMGKMLWAHANNNIKRQFMLDENDNYM